MAYKQQIGTVLLADNAVTNIKLAEMPTNTIKGNNTGGSGAAIDLTKTQVLSLLNVEDGATADQTDAEIESAYNNQVSIVTQVDAEAGTSTTVYRWTPERVKQAIESLGGTTYGNIVTTAALSADEDDWNPTGLAPGALLRIDPGAFNRTITGIDSTGFNNGDILYLSNVSTTKTINLSNEDGDSDADNRFRFSASLVMKASMGATLFYDGAEDRFKTLSEYQA